MVFHARVGVGYVGKGVALRQVMLGLAHVVAGAVEDGLVVRGVVGGGVVAALVGVGLARVGTVVGKVDLVGGVLAARHRQGLECSGVTRVVSTHVQILYFVTRVVRRTRAKR